MWDEQERFAKAVLKALAWAMIAVGVILTGISVATGTFEPFLAYVQFLGILGAIILGYALMVGGTAWAVFGVGRVVSHGLRHLIRMIRRRARPERLDA